MFYINNKIIQFKNHVIKLVTNNVNPLNLPPNTIRVKFSSGYTPTMGDTQTLVNANENIWDIYKQSNNWTKLFNINDSDPFNELLEVLGANTSNVINMSNLFRHCEALTSVSLFDTSNVTNMALMFSTCKKLTSIPFFNTSKVTTMNTMLGSCSTLTSVPLFDTSNVTNMYQMFVYCSQLTYIPLFNISKVTNIDKMFSLCFRVQSGALALYQQASSQTTPPATHKQTFNDCGKYNQTGAAELAQIPDDWKT